MTACEALCAPIAGGVGEQPFPVACGWFWATVPAIVEGVYSGNFPPIAPFVGDERKSRRKNRRCGAAGSLTTARSAGSYER